MLFRLYLSVFFISFLLSACSSGSLSSLEDSSSILKEAQEEFFIKNNKEASLPLYAESCKGGVGEACLFLLEFYSQNFQQTNVQIASKDFFQRRTELLSQTKRVLENSCNKASAKDCFELGIFYRTYLFQYKKSEELFYKSCELGYAMGCIRSSLQEDSKQSLFQKGFEDLTKQCNSGNGESCRWLGVVYATQPRATQSLNDTQIQQTITQFLQKACQLGDIVSCSKLHKNLEN